MHRLRSILVEPAALSSLGRSSLGPLSISAMRVVPAGTLRRECALGADRDRLMFGFARAVSHLLVHRNRRSPKPSNSTNANTTSRSEARALSYGFSWLSSSSSRSCGVYVTTVGPVTIGAEWLLPSPSWSASTCRCCRRPSSPGSSRTRRRRTSPERTGRPATSVEPRVEPPQTRTSPLQPARGPSRRTRSVAAGPRRFGRRELPDHRVSGTRGVQPVARVGLQDRRALRGSRSKPSSRANRCPRCPRGSMADRTSRGASLGRRPPPPAATIAVHDRPERTLRLAPRARADRLRRRGGLARRDGAARGRYVGRPPSTSCTARPRTGRWATRRRTPSSGRRSSARAADLPRRRAPPPRSPSSSTSSAIGSRAAR